MTETETQSRIPLCIYHAGCIDGQAAATVVALAHQTRDSDPDHLDGVELYPGIYNKPIPPEEKLRDREVVLVDFSYKREDMLRLARQAKSVLVLDHHDSAERELVGLPGNVRTIFDQSRSGAVLAWDHYFADQRHDLPRTLAHVQDRDLWQWKMEGTKAVTAALYSYSFDLDLWASFILDNPEPLAEEGAAILRVREQRIESILKHHRIELFRDEHIPVVNAPKDICSEVCHRLLELHPEAPYVISYVDLTEERVYDLRSRKGGVKVNEIAEAYGGGGHPPAAGFTIPLERVYDTSFRDDTPGFEGTMAL